MGVIRPTIRLRRLGAELKRFREEAGLTLEEAGALLIRSPSSVSRFEKGLAHARVRDVDHMLLRYGVTDEAVRERLFDWARNGRKRGWWQGYGDTLSPDDMDFISLEADAVAIRTFELHLIPGLLQTEDYARAVIGVGPFAADRERVERLVAVRLQRQQVLTGPDPPHFHAIVSEAALRQEVGGSEVMRGQLQRLLETSSFHVLSYSVGAHAGGDGAFTILEVREPGDLCVVAADSLTRAWYLEDQKDIERYRQAFDDLRKKALSTTDSHAFVEEILSQV